MPFGKNLKMTYTTYGPAKNILASEHVKFIEGGATLKASAGALPVGAGIARVASTGLWEKFLVASAANYDDYGILNIDVEDSTERQVLGEVIIVGSVYEAKLDASATAAEFKTAVGKNIRYVRHV